MVTDFFSKEIAVGCEVVCLPQHNFRILIPAEVVEMYEHYAMVRFNYPESIFNGREEVERCYYEDMVVIKEKQWPNTCHESHKSVRSSDASTFDFICDDCGATDDVTGGWGTLRKPCKGAK